MNLSGKKVAVLGYGVVGRASLKYAKQKDAFVTLYDNKVYEDFKEEDIKYLVVDIYNKHLVSRPFREKARCVRAAAKVIFYLKDVVEHWEDLQDGK